MFISIKNYIYGAVAGLVAILGAIFVYRGKKIKEQAETIETQEHNTKLIEKYYEQKDKVQSFESANKVGAEKAKHVEKSINTPDGHYFL
jgi:hypothetical protein